MFSKSELQKAIDELEKAPSTFQNAEKLATFYLLYDHLYTEKLPPDLIELITEVTIDRYEGSDFYEAISGRNAEKVWGVMNELMDLLKVTQPKLFEATIERLNSIKS